MELILKVKTGKTSIKSANKEEKSGKNTQYLAVILKTYIQHHKETGLAKAGAKNYSVT